METMILILTKRITYDDKKETTRQALENALQEIKGDVTYYQKNGHEGEEIKELEDIDISVYWGAKCAWAAAGTKIGQTDICGKEAKA